VRLTRGRDAESGGSRGLFRPVPRTAAALAAGEGAS